MDKPNGGPAFPKPVRYVDGNGNVQDMGPNGMTLRMYIATHALAAIISHANKKPQGIDGPKIYAIWAREYADALMEELDEKH